MFSSRSSIDRLAWAGVIAFFLTIVGSYLVDSHGGSMLIRGDFPAFFSASKIVISGESAKLYDPQLQADIQNRYWPNLEGAFYPFAYPPYVAAVTAPLGLLPPMVAKSLHFIVMLAALVLSIYLAGFCFPAVAEFPLRAFSYLIWFAPVLSGVVGGQNSAVSLMLLCGIAAGLCAKRFVTAGLITGLWLYKPHFAVVAAVILSVSLASAERRRYLAGFISVSVAYYLVGSLVMGFGWPVGWLEQVRWFAELDFEHNAFQMVSLFGAAEAIARGGLVGGATAVFTRWVALVISVGVLVAGAVSIRALFEPGRPFYRERVVYGVSALGLLLVVTSAHILSYDLSLVVPAVGCILGFVEVPGGRQSWSRQGSLGCKYRIGALIAFSAAVALFVITRDRFVVQPLTLFPVLLLIQLSRVVKGLTHCTTQAVLQSRPVE